MFTSSWPGLRLAVITYAQEPTVCVMIRADEAHKAMLNPTSVSINQDLQVNRWQTMQKCT